jgi:hypothetical protein
VAAPLVGVRKFCVNAETISLRALTRLFIGILPWRCGARQRNDDIIRNRDGDGDDDDDDDDDDRGMDGADHDQRRSVLQAANGAATPLRSATVPSSSPATVGAPSDRS